MTTHELIVKVKEVLEGNGFEATQYFDHFVQASKDGKAWKEEVKGYDFTRLYGYTVDVQEVHRSNGTEENKSVDISIYHWEASSGKRVAKERLNVNFSEKQISNRVNKIVEQYNNL